MTITDRRLTAPNLIAALASLDTPADAVTLRTNHALFAQVHEVVQHQLDIGDSLQIKTVQNDPSRPEAIYQNFSEHWQLEDKDGAVIFESDGYYDMDAWIKQRGATIADLVNALNVIKDRQGNLPVYITIKSGTTEELLDLDEIHVRDEGADRHGDTLPKRLTIDGGG